MKIKLMIDGIEYPSRRAAAAAFGIAYETFHWRIAAGWSLEEALGRQIRQSDCGRDLARKIAVLAVKGQTAPQIAHDLGISLSITYRVAREHSIKMQAMKSGPRSKRTGPTFKGTRGASWDLEDWSSEGLT